MKVVNLPTQSIHPLTAPIKDWAIDDRPREKLLAKGAHALSDAELLAILLASGGRSKRSAVDIGRELMNLSSNSLYELGRKDVRALQKVSGIGSVRAITIAAALELGRRRDAGNRSEPPSLQCSQDAVEVLRPLIGDQHTEHLYVLFLNRANKLLGHSCVSHGSTSNTLVDPKVIFEQALLQKARKIMLGHNHPSGNPKPSKADLVVTQKIKAAGELLEIELLDHLIISGGSYYSFSESGAL